MSIQEQSSPASSAPIKSIHIVLLVGILVLATGLRVHEIGKTSFWFDEISSVLYARGHTAEIFAPPLGYFEHAPSVASAAGTNPWRDVWFGFDTTPPLYPMLLRLWMNLFGATDKSGRMLSVVFSVGMIVPLFDMGRLIMGPTPALWAALLCAVSPPEIRYAQEARAYALLCLLGVLICDVMVRIVQSGGTKKRFTLLGLLCIAALFTHYFVAGAIAGTGLYGWMKLRGRARSIVISVIAIAFIVGLCEMPILYHHGHNLRRGIDWLVSPRAGLFFRTIALVAALPGDYLVQPLNLASRLCYPSIVLLVLPLFLDSKRPGVMLAGLWSIGIIGLVAASDLWLGHEALLYTRYTLAAAPMVCISFAALADLGGKLTRHLLPSCAVAGALLAVIPWVYTSQLSEKTESRELAADVQSHVAPGDILVIASQPDMGLYSAATAYSAIDFYVGPLPCAVAVLESPADAKMRAAIWRHKHVWLVKTFNGVDASEYLGDCQLVPAGSMRFHAGRLFSAVRSYAATTSGT